LFNILLFPISNLLIISTGFSTACRMHRMSRVTPKQPVVAGERFPKPRTLPRYPITALAEILEPVSRRRVTGWTSAISDTGCHVRAADALAAGTIVQLRIEQKGNTFETWARVASALPEEGMGLAFFDTAQTQRDLLRKWMQEVPKYMD
jgi:PilZ domain-containing protein